MSARAIVFMAALMSVACRVEFGTATATNTTCDDDAPSGRVVLYTSAYREVTDALHALAKHELPDVELVVFQGGSEKVAARLDADLHANAHGADVVLVSDPLLYRRLKKDGHLLPYASQNATAIDRRLVDLDNAFVAARLSTMVVAYHSEKTRRDVVPTVVTPLLRGDSTQSKHTAFADPLSSGTSLFTAAIIGNGDLSSLSHLRRAGAAVGGGNAVVLQRVLSGERDFGVVLLENVLLAKARHEPIDFVMPSDAVVIPGDIAIMRSTKNARAAKAIVDLVLSAKGQALIAGEQGRMHAADPRTPPPDDNVPPLASLLDARPLDEALLQKLASDRTALLRAAEAALLHAP